MKKKKVVRNNRKFIIGSIVTLLFLNFLAHRAWFNPFTIISNGDWFYVYPEALQIAQTASWISAFPQITPFGGANVIPSRLLISSLGQLLANIHLSEQVLAMVLFFLPVWIACPLSSFFLLYKFTKHPIASFLGSLFYLFTTIFLVNAAGGLPFILIYAFAPLLFLLFDNVLHNFSVKNVLLFLLLAAYLNFHAIYLTLILYAILVVYMLFIWITERKIIKIKAFLKEKWIQIGIFTIVAVTTNFYLFLFSLSPIIKSSVDTGITSRALIIPGWLFFDNAITTYYPFWTGTQPTMFYNVPLAWYFWFIPLYVFLSILFVKKNRSIIFFLLVALTMVFLGKGPSDPFPKIYEYLYDYFPLFNIYREASKFWIGIAFSYSILIGFTIVYTFTEIEKRYTSYKKQLYKVFFILPLLVIIFLSAKPAFTNEIGPGYRPYTIPPDYIKLKDALVNDESFYRILQIPALARLMYTSEVHPRISFNDLPSHLRSLRPEVLRLYGIKYAFLPKDPYFDIFPGNPSYEVFEAGIKEVKHLVQDYSFGTKEIKVFKNEKGSVPHIYPIRALHTVFGEMKSIDDVYPLFSDQKANFFVNDPITNPTHIPDKFASVETITISSCTACTNTTSSESASFSSFTTPEEGDIAIFIKKYGIKELTLSIDGNQIPLDSTDSVYFRSTQFLTKGEHTLFVTLLRENLLGEQSDVLLQESKKHVITVPEEKLLDYTPFTFSFDYKLQQKAIVSYVLNQNTDFYFQYQQNKPGGTSWKAAKGELSGDNTWKSFTTTFTTLFNPEWMQFEMKPNNASTTLPTLRNVSLFANITPQIFIKQKHNSQISSSQLPQIIFQQINPTKYVVKITDAKHPFILVFSESYNKTWQAAYTGENEYIHQTEKLLKTDMPGVMQAPYKNSYDLYNLFFTNYHALPDSSHFQINGFGNAWFVDKKGDYTMVIEFKPQKEFMLGVLIAAITFVIGSIVLLTIVVKKTRK